MRYLNYSLPEFVRFMWTGEKVKEIWENRIKRIPRIWNIVEAHSVKEGFRPYALICIQAWEEEEIHAIANGLGLNILSLEKSSYGLDRLILSSRNTFSPILDALNSRNWHVLGSLLGYPDCCCESSAFYGRHRDICRKAALNTASASISLRSDFYSFRCIPQTNMLLYRLGLKSTPHIPCSFACLETVKISRRYYELASSVGYKEEFDQLFELLAAPMEWSCLHGIAEVKTPVFKACMNTDASAHKQVIHLLSTQYPAASVSGYSFPYKSMSEVKTNEWL